MLKIVIRIVAIIFLGFVSGGFGMVVGALIGGNYFPHFVFNGVRGYEATGQVGLILGILISLITSWWFWVKRKSAKTNSHPG